MKLLVESKEYGFSFGLGAYLKASTVFDEDEDTLFNNSAIFNFTNGEVLGISYKVVFGSLLQWCAVNKVKFESDFDQFVESYNNITVEQNKEIIELFKKSKYNHRIVEDIFEEHIALFKVEEPKEDVKVVKKKATSKASLKIVSDGV